MRPLAYMRGRVCALALVCVRAPALARLFPFICMMEPDRGLPSCLSRRKFPPFQYLNTNQEDKLMKKTYEVELEKTVIFNATITVEADNEIEARGIAYSQIVDAAWDDGGDTGYVEVLYVTEIIPAKA